MVSKSSRKKTPQQKRREARRALIIFILATGFFIFALVNYFRIEGGG